MLMLEAERFKTIRLNTENIRYVWNHILITRRNETYRMENLGGHVSSTILVGNAFFFLYKCDGHALWFFVLLNKLLELL